MLWDHSKQARCAQKKFFCFSLDDSVFLQTYIPIIGKIEEYKNPNTCQTTCETCTVMNSELDWAFFSGGF
jgi:hypothetical protein